MRSSAAPARPTRPKGAVRPPRLVSVATALPRHRVDQRNAREFAAALFGRALGPEKQRLLEVFDHSGIETRHTCMPLEWYERPHRFGEANDAYIEHALSLSREASEKAIRAAGLEASDIDHVLFVSSTGLATPSIDARLANLLELREDIRRTPIWGLGCAGGAAGLSHARDMALADPEARVLLIALELCTLTFQHGDLDRRNLVATSLFSDGAAAAVIVGAEARSNGTAESHLESRSKRTSGATESGTRCSFEILASRSTLWRDTLDVMGWTVDEQGLHVVFSRDIPTIVRQWVRANLEDFLAENGAGLESLSRIIAHPGGPKVLGAYAESLGLDPEIFRHAREVLRTCGNMSSPTCLFVLERTLEAGDLEPRELALVAALGPGFSSEYVLIRATG